MTGYFIIDLADLDKVIVKKWRLWQNRFYTGVQKPTTIHKFLLDIPEDSDVVIDHINCNPADNRRSNLRICTQQQNICNSPIKSNNQSGFAGIYFDKSRNKWVTEIKCNYIKCYLGRYEKLEDACFVRYTAEKLLFKDFRNTTNDNNLLPLAEACKNKDKLTEYVEQRISLKYNSK